jgi:tellurite methyltransferase
VSEADGEKWDHRYRVGQYRSRKHPSALLAQWLPQLEPTATPPRALDVACGLGRNAVYLARQGWRVDAVDISRVALDQLAARAAAASLDITCTALDLESEAGLSALLDTPQYDLALVVRYTNLNLIRSLARALHPGGYLLVEEHLVTDAEVVGPRNPRFRVVALAQLVARRRSQSS